MAKVAETHAHLGRAKNYSDLSKFEASEKFKDQKDSRTVKHLMFTYHVIAPSPMIPGEEVIMERTARQGDVIDLDELGTYYLHRGEALDAFFTDDELARYNRGEPIYALPPGETADVLPGGQGAIEPAEFEGTGVFAEMGSHEMVAYMEEHKPSIDQLSELINNDPDAARRLLEAENIVTDEDPRVDVEKLVQKVIKDNS